MRGNHGPAICHLARVRLHSPRLRWRHDPVGHRQGLQNVDSGEPDQRAHKLKHFDLVSGQLERLLGPEVQEPGNEWRDERFTLLLNRQWCGFLLFRAWRLRRRTRRFSPAHSVFSPFRKPAVNE